MKMITKALLAATALCASVSANAATFLLTYSGLPYGNAAKATGSITIDDAALAALNDVPYSNLPYSAVTSLSLTISGASSGNGTFTRADFNQIAFFTPSPLDFSKELIGQPLTTGFTYGDRRLSGSAGDFNLFGISSASPTGVNYFDLATNGGNGNELALTSISAAAAGAVPETATWGMMIAGFGMMGAAMRTRRRSTKVTFA